jgi:hypothetical protein
METVLERVRQRAFGLALTFVVVPTFFPLPVGVGAVTGPLIALLGLQMLIGLRQPWLPRFLREHGVKRELMAKVLKSTSTVLAKLEKLCKPRWTAVSEGWGERVSGLVLVGMGLALALPIPFTNYPFGLLLLAHAIALTERDGVLVAACWIGGAGVVGGLLGVSDALITSLQGFFG